MRLLKRGLVAYLGSTWYEVVTNAGYYPDLKEYNGTYKVSFITTSPRSELKGILFKRNYGTEHTKQTALEAFCRDFARTMLTKDGWQVIEMYEYHQWDPTNGRDQNPRDKEV